MSTAKPASRTAPRKPPVKYFSILHGSALMVGTNPGPQGDDLARKWTLLDKGGRILPGNDMALRYFLFGEAGCQQVGAKDAARMAAQFGGSLETLISGELWHRPRPKKLVAPRKARSLPRRNPGLRS